MEKNGQWVMKKNHGHKVKVIKNKCGFRYHYCKVCGIDTSPPTWNKKNKYWHTDQSWLMDQYIRIDRLMDSGTIYALIRMGALHEISNQLGALSYVFHTHPECPDKSQYSGCTVSYGPHTNYEVQYTKKK